MKEKLLTIFLWMAAVTSLMYLLMLGYFALPTADDWGWSIHASELGSFGFMKMFYFGWQGRFSAILVDGTLCKWFGWNEHMLGFTIIELLLGFGAIYLLLRDMLKIHDRGLLVAASIIVTNLGVMAFPEIGTFYWLCTSNYIHEIWLTLYLVWFIFYCKTKWLQWSGALLCSIYLGGCAENYSPTLALMLGLVWCYLIWKQRVWSFWKEEKLIVMLACALVIGVGFLFMVLAPGNEVRMAAENKSMNLLENFNMINFLTKSAKASVIILLRLLSRSWYFICALPIFVLIGAHSHVSLPKWSWMKVFLFLIIALGIIVVSVAATVLGTGWYATMRANCFIVYVFMAWVAYVGVILGYQMREKISAVHISTILASFAIIFTSVLYISIEYPIVKKYNHDVVTFHHQMQQYVEQGRTEPVVVIPIEIQTRQSSYGYLRNTLQVIFHKSKRYEEHYFPYEPFKLEADPQNWRNQFYRRWLGAQFDIICVDEEVAE